MTTCLLHSISIINAEYHNEHGNVQQNQKQKKKKNYTYSCSSSPVITTSSINLFMHRSYLRLSITKDIPRVVLPCI